MPAPAVLFRNVNSGGSSFRVADVGDRTHLKLFWKDEQGHAYRSFAALNKSHGPLLFATNAGIFATDHTPCGLHIEDGVQKSPLNLGEGTGNFFLQPNGVFYLDANGPAIVPAEEWKDTSNVRLAVQSGPLLLSRGKIHPQISADSGNRQIRSGVGVTRSHHIVFVLSTEPVTFYAFVTVFRDQLDCDDALYLDGAISKFYPGDSDGDFVGILAVTH